MIVLQLQSREPTPPPLFTSLPSTFTLGDSWSRDLIDGFHQLVRRQLGRYQGRLVDTAGDGALAVFDSPARAIA